MQTHTSLTRQAATGRGIDRHLLGLRCVLDASAGERHELFDDPLFVESQTWRLSTSGLSEGHQFRGTGYEEVLLYSCGAHACVGSVPSIVMVMGSIVSFCSYVTYPLAEYPQTLLHLALSSLVLSPKIPVL